MGDIVWYSLFVRSFRDSNGDGIGDLRGVIQGLDYLQDLGVRGIWLLPIFDGPTYHGYETTDYYTVKKDYGTNADLAALIKEMRRRDMYLILDYVVHHTGDKHPLFLDAFGNLQSKYSSFYRWENDQHTRYDTFAGVTSMPRLNFDSAEMRQYITEVALYWLDPNQDGDTSDGVDGYRVDVAGRIPRDFFAELRTAMNTVNPRAILLGEVWDETTDIAQYLRNQGLDAAFDFPAYQQMSGEHDANGTGFFNGAGDLSLIGLPMRAMNNLKPAETFAFRFTNNHDTNRIVSKLNGDRGRIRAAAVWLLTIPGVPMVYYGEEIGMKGSKGTGPIYDEFRREPLDWYANETGTGMTRWFKPNNRNNAPNDGISIQEQSADPNSLLTLYKDLIALRNNTPAMHSGGKFDLPKSGTLHIARFWDGQEMLLVVINFAKTSQAIEDILPFLAVENTQYGEPQLILSERARQTGQTLALEPSGFIVLRATK
jgi:alpha-amylase